VTAALTATVLLLQPPEPVPHCGVFHFVERAQVKVVSPVDGLPTEPLWVAISCPEMQPRLAAGDTLCMTITADNPGWPAPVRPLPPEETLRYALTIAAGPCPPGDAAGDGASGQ